MEKHKKIELANRLIDKTQGCVGDGGDTIYLYAYSEKEEQRLRDLVAERKLDFIVRYVGFPAASASGE